MLMLIYSGKLEDSIGPISEQTKRVPEWKCRPSATTTRTWRLSLDLKMSERAEGTTAPDGWRASLKAGQNRWPEKGFWVLVATFGLV
jgi:hypothetical protein